MLKKEDHIITDNATIHKALAYPQSLLGKMKFNPLVPFGYMKFKGDKLPAGWSANPFFTVGKEYPIYESDGGQFVIGSDGIGKQINHGAWSNRKHY